jgi:hypothetical protein
MKLEMRKKAEKPQPGTEVSTYVRINNPWRLRFKMLATKAGYTRAENDLGVDMFVSALAVYTLDYIRQTDAEAHELILAANVALTPTDDDLSPENNAVWFYDLATGKLDGTAMRAAIDKANPEAATEATPATTPATNRRR